MSGRVKTKFTVNRLRTVVAGLTKRWNGPDRLVVIYTLVTGAFITLRRAYIAEAFYLLVFRAVVLLFLFLLPPCGTEPRRSTADDEPPWRTIGRDTAWFLRYTYPLALVIFFFEEVQYTVNAVAPASPYWFESHLYAADRFLFGELPARWLAVWTSPVLDELFHALYFSYYLIVLGAAITAYRKARSCREATETAMASTLTAYFVGFLCYPLLPARGPWEHPEVMQGLPPFRGVVFTPLVEWIIHQGAVSGGCFPSSHVSGAWGMVIGLARYDKGAALYFALLATGMSLACVYTRYHHGVDVIAGLLIALAAGGVAPRLVRRKNGGP